MKIARASNNKMLFQELLHGDVFMANDKYYMKAFSNTNNNDDNAVCLSEGRMCCFCGSQVVYLVDCELVIK